jgi:hypothetical protein
VVCPECYSTRCRSCQHRFYAWNVPVSLLFYAHCPQCADFALEKISGRLALDGNFKWLKRVLGFAAYRCPGCRSRFFSGLIYLPILSDRDEKLAGTTK